MIAPTNPSKEKYDEDLKAFLTPKLTGVEATKSKKYSKKLKLYAEALGIAVQTPPPKINENKKSKRST